MILFKKIEDDGSTTTAAIDGNTKTITIKVNAANRHAAEVAGEKVITIFGGSLIIEETE